MIRVAILASTGGSVYDSVCRASTYVKDRVVLVVSDRRCGAVEAAMRHGHVHRIIPWSGRFEFSDRLLDTLKRDRIDLCVSFFTRILAGDIITEYRPRLVNFHPSILPACPGMHGFEDTLKSGARFVGSTVHLVDDGMDTGKPVIQSCYPANLAYGTSWLRHRVFLQQCKMLVQVVRWYEEGRIRLVDDQVEVVGSQYEVNEFSPMLDDEEAMNLEPSGVRE